MSYSAVRYERLRMGLQPIARLAAFVAIVAVLAMSGWSAAQSPGDALMKPSEVERLFPATVYYCGRNAPAQLRNSGGVKSANGHYVLASLIDTAGYSSSVTDEYRGYLITEVPLKVGGQKLLAGAYGIGFLSGICFGSRMSGHRSTKGTVGERHRHESATALADYD